MKENKILITYSTMSGSTQEIAEFIFNELVEQKLDVELKSVRTVSDVSPYSVVVLGVPLYMFHFQKDAIRFLQRNKKYLRDKPVAMFCGGPYVSNSVEDWNEVQRQVDAELAKISWFKPISIHLVGGRFDPALLCFPYNLIPALKQSLPSDLRDWNAIRNWSHCLPDLLNLSEKHL